MTLPWIDRSRALYLADLALLLMLNHYFVPMVEAAAQLVHVPLPEMPLLKRTYLYFGFILVVCAWFRMRGEKLSEFGLIVPARWVRTIGLGLLVFAASIIFDLVVLAGTRSRRGPSHWHQHNAGGTAFRVAARQFFDASGSSAVRVAVRRLRRGDVFPRLSHDAHRAASGKQPRRMDRRDLSAVDPVCARPLLSGAGGRRGDLSRLAHRRHFDGSLGPKSLAAIIAHGLQDTVGSCAVCRHRPRVTDTEVVAVRSFTVAHMDAVAGRHKSLTDPTPSRNRSGWP